MNRRNVINFVIAFVLALVAWASIRLGGDNQINFTAKIELTGVPSGLIVTEKLRDTVSVTLRGSRAGLARLRDEDMKLSIDISDRMEGIANIELGSSQIPHLPAGVVVAAISPPVITVKLEPLMEMMVPVRENLVGPLPEGYSLKLVEIHPAQVLFRGPARLGKKIKEVLFEPVEARTLVRQPEREVSLISAPEVFPYLNPRKVSIRAELAEESIERSIEVSVNPQHRDGHMVVTAPPAVTVRVIGPVSAVRGLSRASFTVEADFSPYPPGRYKQVIPKVRIGGTGVQNGLEISYSPKQFDVVVSSQDGKQ